MLFRSVSERRYCVCAAFIAELLSLTRRKIDVASAPTASRHVMHCKYAKGKQATNGLCRILNSNGTLTPTLPRSHIPSSRCLKVDRRHFDGAVRFSHWVIRRGSSVKVRSAGSLRAAFVFSRHSQRVCFFSPSSTFYTCVETLSVDIIHAGVSLSLSLE